MRANEPTLLLTRPSAQSKVFLKACEAGAGRELRAVISPLMQIEPTGTVPDLDRYATIIFTSANGVNSISERASLVGRSVLTVGEMAAIAARSAGAEAMPLGGDVEEFLSEAAHVKGPALFCRGVHSRGDLAERLRDKGHRVDEAVVYDQVAVPLTEEAERLLADVGPVVAPLFSPRSAHLLTDQGPFAARMSIVAMSAAVADAWSQTGEVVIADTPVMQAMVDLTVLQLDP